MTHSLGTTTLASSCLRYLMDTKGQILFIFSAVVQKDGKILCFFIQRIYIVHKFFNVFVYNLCTKNIVHKYTTKITVKIRCPCQQGMYCITSQDSRRGLLPGKETFVLFSLGYNATTSALKSWIGSGPKQVIQNLFFDSTAWTCKWVKNSPKYVHNATLLQNYSSHSP